jgi:TonB family protein
MSDKGHVVLTFYVHKNGAMADLRVVTPSVAAFNNSAYHAVASSGPFAPLPQEYPDERAFFTITFYFNESPPKAQVAPLFTMHHNACVPMACCRPNRTFGSRG